MPRMAAPARCRDRAARVRDRELPLALAPPPGSRGSARTVGRLVPGGADPEPRRGAERVAGAGARRLRTLFVFTASPRGSHPIRRRTGADEPGQRRTRAATEDAPPSHGRGRSRLRSAPSARCNRVFTVRHGLAQPLRDLARPGTVGVPRSAARITRRYGFRQPAARTAAKAASFLDPGPTSSAGRARLVGWPRCARSRLGAAILATAPLPDQMAGDRRWREPAARLDRPREVRRAGTLDRRDPWPLGRYSSAPAAVGQQDRPCEARATKGACWSSCYGMRVCLRMRPSCPRQSRGPPRRIRCQVFPGGAGRLRRWGFREEASTSSGAGGPVPIWGRGVSPFGPTFGSLKARKKRPGDDRCRG
jgi:hypothetical protein